MEYAGLSEEHSRGLTDKCAKMSLVLNGPKQVALHSNSNTTSKHAPQSGKKLLIMYAKQPRNSISCQLVTKKVPLSHRITLNLLEFWPPQADPIGRLLLCLQHRRYDIYGSCAHQKQPPQAQATGSLDGQQSSL